MVSYQAGSVAEYLALIDDDWRREKILTLMNWIETEMPQWQATVSYNMLGFGPVNDPQMHMNAQKSHVAIYVGDVDKIDPERALLGRIDCGKGCVRLKRKDALDDNLRSFLRAYFALKRDGQVLGGRAG